MERPLWRWLLFCAANWLYGRVSWQWPLDLMAWCVLPEWLGGDDSVAVRDEECPF